MLSFPYRYGLLRRYPGLQPEDKRVWETFITQFPNFFDACDYNVRVGSGTCMSKDAPPSHKKMVKMNSKLKIDVLATKQSSIYIIELKPYFMPSAIGQLLCYKFCFEEDTNFIITPQMAVICNYAQSDAARYALQNDIHVLTIPPRLLS